MRITTILTLIILIGSIIIMTTTTITLQKSQAQTEHAIKGIQKLQLQLERTKMYYHQKGLAKDWTNGIYNYNQEYYCVWTKNRIQDFINQTETHEKCHALTHKRPQHFCRGLNYENNTR